MPLFCYVHRAGGSIPYLEVFPELSREGALIRAAELLEDRPDCLWAEIWDDENLIETIQRQPTSVL